MINNKLKPDVKRRWIDNLRSRRYRQTFGGLRDEEEKTPKGVVRPVCAIGALWEVAVKDGVAQRASGGYMMVEEGLIETGLTTDGFAQWAGFEDRSAMEQALVLRVPNPDYDENADPEDEYDFEPEYLDSAIWDLNDSGNGFDFPKLAKLIDRGL